MVEQGQAIVSVSMKPNNCIKIGRSVRWDAQKARALYAKRSHKNL